MTYAMEENNHKGQYKVKHRTHTIPDCIPSKYDNTKHMIYRMGEYIPTVQDKITRRTHKITEYYLDGQSKVYRTTDWWTHSELTR
jgi:hypothetical protein